MRECWRGEKAGKTRSDARTAACVNAQRKQSRRNCILIKEDRHARMPRRSKAEKMRSDAWTAACEYREREKSEKMRPYPRRVARLNAKGVKKL